MLAEHVRPFAEASLDVIERVLGVRPQRGDLVARRHHLTAKAVNIVCPVRGALDGEVVIGMTQQTASLVVAKLLGGPMESMDPLAVGALAELGNMIGQAATTTLSGAGARCTSATPTIVMGANVCVNRLEYPAIGIALDLGEFGVVDVSVSLQTANSRAA